MRSCVRVLLFALLGAVPGCSPGCGGGPPKNWPATMRPAANRPSPTFPAGQRIDLSQVPSRNGDILRMTHAFPWNQVVELAPGDPRITSPPVLPVLTIAQPTDGAAMNAGQDFVCVARVVLPPGASLPSWIDFSMDLAGGHWGGPDGLPLGREPDGAYLYAGKFDGPTKTGPAKLRARGVVEYRTGPYRPDKPPADQTFKIEAPPVALQMRKAPRSR